MKKLSYFFIILGFLIGTSGCVAVFNNPIDESSESTASSSGSSSSASTSSLSFDSFAVNNQVGWLKKISGTCGTESALVSVTTGTSSGSATCSSGVWSIYLDVSAESTGTLTLTASHNGLTESTTLNKVSSACDTAGDRDNTYAGGMAGGAGTSASPYVICTADQLAEIVNGNTDDYILQNDIYFENSDTNGDGTTNGSDTDYLSGSGWSPLAYNGDFNGNHFMVSNLTISRSGTTDVGLFSSFGNNSVNISNLHLRDATVHGNDYVGILVGDMNQDNSIYNSSSTGTVECEAGYCGGLVGSTSSLIKNCYSTADVTNNAGSYTGGLIGYGNTGFTITSYATGEVTSASGHVGGLIGYANFNYLYQTYARGNVTGGATRTGGLAGRMRGTFYYSFATGDVEGTTSVGGLIGSGYNDSLFFGFATGNVSGDDAGNNVGPLYGSGRPETESYYWSGANCTNLSGSCGNSQGTAEADLTRFYDVTQSPLSYFDFEDGVDTKPSDIWLSQTDSFPLLWFQASTAYDFTAPFSGSGTSADPYLIQDADDLEAIGSNPRYLDSTFQLTASFSAATLSNFQGIGIDTPFFGTFDGNGQTISNVTVNRPLNSGVGFIGYIRKGSIQDLTVSNVDMDGYSYVGGIVGIISESNLSNVHVTGGDVASTDDYGGGAIGAVISAESNTIAGSSASADVSGSHCTGGFIGSLRNTNTITTSYATGAVTGLSDSGAEEGLGGFAGCVSGLVEDSYATGDVTSNGGRFYAGGFAGTGGTIRRCYSTGDVDTSPGGLGTYVYAGGFIGNGGTIENSFSTGDVIGSNTGTNVGLFHGGSVTASTNNWVWAGASVTNPGGGGTHTNGYSTQANVSDFYDPTNDPMTGNWDFGSVWQDNSGSSALPTLQ